MEKRSMIYRLILSLIIRTAVLPIADCQKVCPDRCLCYLDQVPKTIMCSKQGLETFPGNISDIVEHLDLSSNLLTQVSEDVNELIKLLYLNLAKNRLTSLPKDLDQLEKLQRLDLSDNYIASVADIASISQLPSLVLLYISRNPLPALEGLTSNALRVMDASHCLIKELGNASLSGLSALTNLNLAGNPLRNIKRPVSATLRSLDMSDCNLNVLEPNTFIGFPELEGLRLINNPSLVYCTRYTTLQHAKLKRFDVSRCRLDRPGLHGFPSLTYARLSHNAISMLPNRIFAKNKQLVQLYLDVNHLQNVNASSFEGLTKLQMLDLSMNSISYVHELALRDNINLKVLNFSYNELQTIPRLTSAVISLDVSFNKISKLRANSLENMSRIMYLNLKNNELQMLPRHLKAATLRMLHLQKNRIIVLHNKSFSDLPSLREIDLSGNRLTEPINPDIFDDNPLLYTIYLEDNPWRCDCGQLYSIYQFLTDPPAKTIASTLLCQSPANATGFTWEAACFKVWNDYSSLHQHNASAWGVVVVGILIAFVLFGSVVSIRYTIKMKRKAIQHRRQLERIHVEALERSRFVQRNEHVSEDLQERLERSERTEPRIHPLEIIGPPTYEEAVQMPRMVRSMDALNEIAVENGSGNIMGSLDNLRMKKRRTRRPRKRTQSEDDLLRREERRHVRLRRERNSISYILDVDQPQNQNNTNPRNPRSTSARRTRRHSVADESIESSSSRDRPRPQTPNSRRRKRKLIVRNEPVTDDEDSDAPTLGSTKSVAIKELKREPRSGYRESVARHDS